MGSLIEVRCGRCAGDATVTVRPPLLATAVIEADTFALLVTKRRRGNRIASPDGMRVRQPTGRDALPDRPSLFPAPQVGNTWKLECRRCHGRPTPSARTLRRAATEARTSGWPYLLVDASARITGPHGQKTSAKAAPGGTHEAMP